MRIKQLVNRLVKKYGTRNPEKIATMMGIEIQYRPLKGILGYFQTYSRIPVIHVASGLSEELTLFVIAHELAHRILHPKNNVPFLRANTFMSIDKIEREANELAVELLIPDELLLEGISIYDAAGMCGVPREVACLKSKPSS